MHNDEIQNVHFWPNATRMINSMRMRWVRHAAHMGEDEKKKA
jgi:hypothetical protein